MGKQDEKSKESERENEESIKVVEVKEEKHLAMAQDDNETQEKSAKINIAEKEEPAFVPESVKGESSFVSHKVTGSSMTKIHSPSIQTAVVNSTQDINPLLGTENTYSPVAHQVCDVTEKPSESQSVINTSKTEPESSSLTHKVSQFDPDLRTSIVAHQVNDTVVKTDLPVNPIYDQGEEMKDSTAEDQIGGMEDDQNREKEIIKSLENENQQLKAFIPDDILDNLPADLQQSLLQKVYQARDDIVKKDLMDTKEERKDLEKKEEKREDLVATNEEKKDLDREEENPIDNTTLSKDENQYQSS